MSRISEELKLSWIYIGSKKDAKNLAELQRKGIRYVINVTPSRNEGGVSNFYENYQSNSEPLFIYHRIVLQDNASERLSTHFEDAWKFIEYARIREDGNLLVHCNQGISRSVSIIVSYMMKYHRYRYEEALGLIRDVRPEAKPNDIFHKELQEFDMSLYSNNDYATSDDSNNNNKECISVVPSTFRAKRSATPPSQSSKSKETKVCSNKSGRSKLIGPVMPENITNPISDKTIIIGPSQNNSSVISSSSESVNSSFNSCNKIDVLHNNIGDSGIREYTLKS